MSPKKPGDDGKIHAPWPAGVVDALNRYQHASIHHEFTCVGHEGGGDRTLVATRKGWICCHCDYRQAWAWRHMLLTGV